jgi:hypothetical protein
MNRKSKQQSNKQQQVSGREQQEEKEGKFWPNFKWDLSAAVGGGHCFRRQRLTD